MVCKKVGGKISEGALSKGSDRIESAIAGRRSYRDFFFFFFLHPSLLSPVFDYETFVHTPHIMTRIAP